MSVRVCYLQRAARGRVLTGLRLVGQGVDDVWKSPGVQVSAYEAGAQWLAERLGESRSARELTMLCLDVEGTVCSWVQSHATDDASIGTLAREGHSVVTDDDAAQGRAAVTPTSFIAGDQEESTVQAMVIAPPVERKASVLPVKPAQHARSSRLPVLATADVSARLLVDALDAENITVERSSTVWHALAGAWDRKARAGELESTRVVGTLCLIEEPGSGGRIVWSWSRAGELLLGGSMRVGLSRPQTDVAPADGAISLADAPASVSLGDAELGRLVTEWLSWSAQTGEAPDRIVCILPDLPPDESGAPRAALFSQRLAAAWQGATVDLVTEADPLGATLRRLAESLDSSAPTAESPSSSLVTLSRRPGRVHRRMYLWSSVAATGLAAAMGLVAWRLSDRAAEARAASAAWQSKWRDLLQEHFPQAVEPLRPGEPPRPAPLELVREEVGKLQEARKPADRAEATMPILQELDSLSFLIANPDYALESIELDSLKDVRLNLQINSLREAEEFLTSLKEIEGLHTIDWEARYPAGNARPDPNEKLRMVYIGRWKPELKRATRGGGS